MNYMMLIANSKGYQEYLEKQREEEPKEEIPEEITEESQNTLGDY